MIKELTSEDKRWLSRYADQPFLWIRKHVPEALEWEDELYDLIDSVKIVWDEVQKTRIYLCFILDFDTRADDGESSPNIRDYIALQKEQVDDSSTLFIIDLHGTVLERAHLQGEVEPVSARNLSQQQQIVVFWLGPELEIYFSGHRWRPENKREILKDIKSKRRDRLLSMQDYRKVLDTHFHQCLRGEATTDFWLPGFRNKVLRTKPEKIFQKSLWDFLNREVDCNAEMEPMFKDGSRCDVKVFVENFDMYFIEIKWIGFCARRKRGTNDFTADAPTEMNGDYAVGGAYQTKSYIEDNNAVEYDHRIKLGIYLVYDAYPDPKTPLDYGKELDEFPLLATCEYPLVLSPPSKRGQKRARQTGTSKP